MYSPPSQGMYLLPADRYPRAGAAVIPIAARRIGKANLPQRRKNEAKSS